MTWSVGGSAGAARVSLALCRLITLKKKFCGGMASSYRGLRKFVAKWKDNAGPFNRTRHIITLQWRFLNWHLNLAVGRLWKIFFLTYAWKYEIGKATSSLLSIALVWRAHERESQSTSITYNSWESKVPSCSSVENDGRTNASFKRPLASWWCLSAASRWNWLFPLELQKKKKKKREYKIFDDNKKKTRRKKFSYLYRGQQ